MQDAKTLISSLLMFVPGGYWFQDGVGAMVIDGNQPYTTGDQWFQASAGYCSGVDRCSRTASPHTLVKL